MNPFVGIKMLEKITKKRSLKWREEGTPQTHPLILHPFIGMSEIIQRGDVSKTEEYTKKTHEPKALVKLAQLRLRLLVEAR